MRISILHKETDGHIYASETCLILSNDATCIGYTLQSTNTHIEIKKKDLTVCYLLWLYFIRILNSMNMIVT